MMSLLRNRNTDDLLGPPNGLANPARPATGLSLRGFAALFAPALLTVLFSFSPGARAAAPKSFDIMNRTIEEKAPDFVLTDLDGRKYRLSDHRGKRPVLLIFSTTWCPSCKEEIPHLKSLHATYAKRGIEMVNIDIQQSREKVAKYAAKNKLPYRRLLEEE